MHRQLKRHVGHPDHVLRDAGQDKAVVIPAHVDESEVDGVNVRPVDVGLEIIEDGIVRLKPNGYCTRAYEHVTGVHLMCVDRVKSIHGPVHIRQRRS